MVRSVNRPLVTYEPVEFEIQHGDLEMQPVEVRVQY